jgi:hypothetical protein
LDAIAEISTFLAIETTARKIKAQFRATVKFEKVVK